MKEILNNNHSYPVTCRLCYHSLSTHEDIRELLISFGKLISDFFIGLPCNQKHEAGSPVMVLGGLIIKAIALRTVCEESDSYSVSIVSELLINHGLAVCGIEAFTQLQPLDTLILLNKVNYLIIIRRTVYKGKHGISVGYKHPVVIIVTHDSKNHICSLVVIVGGCLIIALIVFQYSHNCSRSTVVIISVAGLCEYL